MREIVFINSNISRWKKLEASLGISAKTNPDELAELFIQLTDDLSYARTYYPRSETISYLNSLALRAHMIIYKNKRERRNRIAHFWLIEFPETFYRNRHYFLYSLIVTFVASLIGIISAANDPDFIRLIMGDNYVNMTLENIANNDPMAVYKSANGVESFLGITINNVRVSLLAYMFGIFISIGTAWILFSNGVMLGSFHYFMYEQDVLGIAMSSIWMHGVLEIFAILVAGGAGIAMGHSILFPQTFKRTDSFKKGVKSGLILAIGLVPAFIIAGFIEGFITRFTGAALFLKLGVIYFSLFFIIQYFFVYPYMMFKSKVSPSIKALKTQIV